jgi:hypothetical protein
MPDRPVKVLVSSLCPALRRELHRPFLLIRGIGRKMHGRQSPGAGRDPDCWIRLSRSISRE